MRKPKISVIADNKTECQDLHWTKSLLNALGRVYEDVTEFIRRKGQ